MTDDFKSRLELAKKKLSEVSPSFCAAKWLQSSVHLETGKTQSCHHPPPHEVPLNELNSNDSALHNTEYKKQQRKLMLQGIRPTECNYCWKVEDLKGSQMSDRFLKSSEPWSLPFLDQISKQDWKQNIDPKYIEVSFSSACNFKCSYCNPEVSSTWLKEIVEHGPYPTSDNYNKLINTKKYNEENNPYVESFFNWWPTLKTKLEHFRITGGEPLLSESTFKTIQMLIDDPSPNLEFSVNTNLGVTPKRLQKFIELSQQLLIKNGVKQLSIFTSVDTWGEQAEYIRHGMVFKEFWQNVRLILNELPGIKLTLMVTFNALSVPRYKELLTNYLALKREFIEQSEVILDASVLMHPQFLSVEVLNGHLIEHVRDCYNFVCENLESDTQVGFTFKQKEKMRRIFETIQQKRMEPQRAAILKNDLMSFLQEHDRRRGTQFLQIFPQFSGF